ASARRWREQRDVVGGAVGGHVDHAAEAMDAVLGLAPAERPDHGDLVAPRAEAPGQVKGVALHAALVGEVVGYDDADPHGREAERADLPRHASTASRAVAV